MEYSMFKMVDKIKLDIISDVVCPWCIIGYKRLERAISEMGIQDKVELEWQPFEPSPSPLTLSDLDSRHTFLYLTILRCVSVWISLFEKDTIPVILFVKLLVFF